MNAPRMLGDWVSRRLRAAANAIAGPVARAVWRRAPKRLPRPALLDYIAGDRQVPLPVLRYVKSVLETGGEMLIFGVGQDTAAWEFLTSRPIVFLENEEERRATALAARPEREIHRVEYTTRHADDLTIEQLSEIPVVKVPAAVEDRDWRIVVVDGPRGWRPESHGRSSSIRASIDLASGGGSILVYDYDRPSIRHICDVVFGKTPDVRLESGYTVAVFQAT